MTKEDLRQKDQKEDEYIYIDHVGFKLQTFDSFCTNCSHYEGPAQCTKCVWCLQQMDNDDGQYVHSNNTINELVL